MAGENSEASSSGSEAGEQQGTPEGGSVSSPEQHPGQNKDLLKDVLSAAVPEIAVIRAIDEGTAMIWEKALHRKGKGKITPQEIVDYIKEKAKKPDKASENKNQAGKGAVSSGAGTGQPSRSFEPDKDQLLEDRMSEELDKSLKNSGIYETPQERFDRKFKGKFNHVRVENNQSSEKNESSGGEPQREPEKETSSPDPAEEELKALREIGPLGRRIIALFKTPPEVLTPDQWRSEYLSLLTGAAEAGDHTESVLEPYLAQISDYIESKSAAGEGSRQPENPRGERSNRTERPDEAERTSSGNLDEEVIARGVYKGVSKDRSENEPSLEVALLEFRRAERLCESHDIDAREQILNKIKDPEIRKRFELEAKIFDAALGKRVRGGGTIDGIGKNEALMKITTTDLVDLFKRMPGYLTAMQEIADIVVNRRNVGNLDYSLLDCQQNSQFLEAFAEIEGIVARGLVSGRSEQEAKALASVAVSTAINTMYAFNVFERYNSFWGISTAEHPDGGRIRYKFLESTGNVRSGDEQPTKYDRLVAKPIQDGLCPMDDFIYQALTPDVKNPKPDRLFIWAKNQMAKSGVRGFKDFDIVKVLRSDRNDAKRYWTLERDNQGRRVLLVPPLRPKHILGSILDDNEVNLVGGRVRKPFINALANKDEIDFANLGMPVNAPALYCVGASDLDSLKNSFRGREVKGGLPEIMRGLGSFDLGRNMELIAWMHAGFIQGIEIDSRTPILSGESLYLTRIPREYMGLPKSDRFNLISYLEKLPERSKIAW